MEKNNLKLKQKYIYRLHRNDEMDHEFGRPAILFDTNENESIVWIGTTKFDKFNNEKPLILKINGKETNFYGTALRPVKTDDLKKYWINEKTNESYIISSNQEEQLLKKFISFTGLTNPYKEVDYLQKTIKKEKKKNNQLLHELKTLKKEKKKIKNDKKIINNKMQDLILKNNTLISEKELINDQKQKISEHNLKVNTNYDNEK